MCTKLNVQMIYTIIITFISSMLVGCSGSPKTPTSPPSAPDVYIKGSGLVTGTDIEITNKDSFDWQNVEVELNPGISPGPYNYHVDIIKALSTFPAPSANFKNAAGQPFDISKSKPKTIAVRCTTPQGKGLFEGEWE